MNFTLIIGVLLAGVLHVGFILFGGLLFGDGKKDQGSLQQVELLSEEETKKEDEKKEPDEVKTEQTDAEPPPDAAEIIRNLETPTPMDAPALDAASLSAIEAALNGLGGSGDFGATADLTGGGVIGGKGKPGSLNDKLEGAFNLTEIDQKPRAVFQSSPMYPSELRSKKIEGVVTVIFVVEANGKVSNPRVEKSNNAAFEKPALEAVKKWKFEAGVKAGQRVACKMRVSVRFPPN